MRYIIIILLLIAFATNVQAEWTWVCWERFTSKQGRQENTFDGWQAVGIFSEKERCEEHVQAMVLLTSKRWTPSKEDGSEVFVGVITDDGEDFGKPLEVIKKFKGDAALILEWRCLPRTAPQPTQQRKKGGNK